jgi:hypothetical protein
VVTAVAVVTAVGAVPMPEAVISAVAATEATAGVAGVAGTADEEADIVAAMEAEAAMDIMEGTVAGAGAVWASDSDFITQRYLFTIPLL